MRETLDAAGSRHPGFPGREAYVRLLLTRGVGELSYDPAACPTPSLVDHRQAARRAARGHLRRTASVSRSSPSSATIPRSLNPLIKSNNLLNNALAMQQALKQGAFEAVMRNHRGEIAECSQSNLFVVKSGTAITPPLDAGLLAGITREFLFEVAQEMGVPMAEATVQDEDLLGADEAFLTSTTREVVPIVLVDEHRIGTGHPGPVTRALLEGFRRRADLVTSAQQG